MGLLGPSTFDSRTETSAESGAERDHDEDGKPALHGFEEVADVLLLVNDSTSTKG